MNMCMCGVQRLPFLFITVHIVFWDMVSYSQQPSLGRPTSEPQDHSCFASPVLGSQGCATIPSFCRGVQTWLLVMLAQKAPYQPIHLPSPCCTLNNKTLHLSKALSSELVVGISEEEKNPPFSVALLAVSRHYWYCFNNSICDTYIVSGKIRSYTDVTKSQDLWCGKKRRQR